MTPEAQQIAIAEACGWENVHRLIIKNVRFHGDDRMVGITSDNGWIPDYLNDLNAMHEAEKVLTHEQLPKYFNMLESIVIPDWTFRASAAQRAEAFLRTLNLWID